MWWFCYPFQNFNVATVEVWKMIGNFIHTLQDMWLLIQGGMKVNPRWWKRPIKVKSIYQLQIHQQHWLLEYNEYKMSTTLYPNLHLIMATPLLSFMQYMGLYEFSLPVSLTIIAIICVLYHITIFKSQVWLICHYLGLGHETTACAVCFYVFLFVFTKIGSLISVDSQWMDWICVMGFTLSN